MRQIIKTNKMNSDHKTITFTEMTFEEHIPDFENERNDEDNEGEDLELMKHAQQYEQQQSRRFEPPRSLMLESTVNDFENAVQSHDKVKQPNTEIEVFDFDINFDLDESEDIIDYSVYENRTGLAEDMKVLASMPELCDITFLVGKLDISVCHACSTS